MYEYKYNGYYYDWVNDTPLWEYDDYRLMLEDLSEITIYDLRHMICEKEAHSERGYDFTVEYIKKSERSFWNKTLEELRKVLERLEAWDGGAKYDNDEPCERLVEDS